MPLTDTMALPSITTTRPTGAIVFHEQRREGGGGITCANFRGNLAYRQDHGEISDRDHVRFWRELALAKATRFPNAALVPMGQRLVPWLGLERSR